MDVYDPKSDEYLEQIGDEYDWYCWEEQDFIENTVVYDHGLEYLMELPSKEKHR